MSLQVWLPLNEDLHNQGLTNVEIVNNGNVSVNNNGKIGKCYQFDTNKYLKIIDYAATFLTYNTWSLSLWFKCTAQNTSHPGSALISGGNWNKPNELLNLALGSFSTDHYTKLLISGSGNWANGYSYNFYLNTWYHIALTSGNGAMRAYVNGILIGDSYAAFKPSNLEQSWICIGNGTYYQSFHFKGLMNDIRIYDHCLSVKEVEEISKGLVVHYKLDDIFCETTTNLITTEDGLSNTCYNGSKGKYGYGANTDMYKTTGVFNGRFSTKVYMGTAGQAAYPYVYFDPFNAKGAEIQTLSFDYYPTAQDKLIAYSYNGTYNFSYTSGINSGSGTNISSIIIPVTIGTWNHITLTAQKTDTTNTTRGIGYLRIGAAAHTSTTTDYWLFANIQVENKDHATGYAGINGSRTPTTIYDCSGYGNDGTIVGSLTAAADSSRYEISTQFSGTNYFKRVSPSPEAVTISLWAKWNSIPSGQSVVYVDYKSKTGFGLMSTGILCSSCGLSSYTFDKSNIVANTWYHFVIVSPNGASNTTRKLYINGMEQTPKTTTSNWTFSVDELQIGKRSTTSDGFNGKISDFRMYTIALSTEQIKELYNTSATIDAFGNIYARELKEV